jgi:Tol biopolymer transport system component
MQRLTTLQMPRFALWLLVGLMMACLLAPLALYAQDALNLPADLFILNNNGVVQRYGTGAAGVSDVTPGDIFVVDFGVAPDGDLIAYRTESSINVISMMNLIEPRIIEREADVPPYRGRGETISWSPDQNAIAYTTTYGARVFLALGDVAAYADLREGLFVDLDWSPDGRFLAAQTDAGVWWIYRRDATTLTLTSVIPAANGMTWVAGEQIIFAPPEGGLLLMNLDLANQQTVILEDTWDYYLPALNAADELVFFARDKADEATPQGYGRLQGLQRGAAEVLSLSETPVLTTNLRWAPGGTLLIAFDGGVVALYDPISGQGFPLPVSDAVAYTWGRFDAQAFFEPQPITPVVDPTQEIVPDVEVSTVQAVTGVQLSEDAFFLAYGEFNVGQLWRLPANGSPAVPLTGIPSGVSEYTVSPDLSSIIYVSEGQLWLLTLATARAIPLTVLEGVGFATPAISPDGQTIAYSDGGIRLISAAGEDARILLGNTDDVAAPAFFGEPQFSPDGTQLLVSELLPGTNGVHGVLTIADGSYQRLETDYGARALWLTDGSIISYGYTPQDTPPPQQSIVRFATGAFTTPETIYQLASSTRIETIVESVRGEIRLITQAAEAAPQMIDVAYATGAEATITTLPQISAARLSYDGGFVAGYLNQVEVNGIRQGALTLYNANTEEQVLLATPTSVWQFQWAR